MERLIISKLLRRSTVDTRPINELMDTAQFKDFRALIDNPEFVNNTDLQQTIANRFLLPLFPTIIVPRPSFKTTDGEFMLESVWGKRKFSVPEDPYAWDPLIPHHWHTITKPSAYMSLAVNIPKKLVGVSWGYVNVREQLAYCDEEFKVRKDNDSWYKNIQRGVSEAIECGLIEHS